MSSRSLRLLALLPGLGLMTLIWLRFTLSGGSPLKPAFIQNPDALVRLARIRQWLNGGDWPVGELARVGVSDHVHLTWSRAVDVVVWAANAVSGVLTTGGDTLVLAATLVSLPLGYVALLGAAHIPTVFDLRAPWVMGLAALTIPVMPFFAFVYSAVGWPDHHGVMLLTFVLMILTGWSTLTTHSRAAPGVFALVQGYGLWISPEMLVAVAAVHAGLGLAWVVSPHTTMAARGLRAALAFPVVVVAVLGLEYGFAVPGLALDRLSWFSMLVAGGTTAVWAVRAWAEGRGLRPWLRLGAGLAAAGGGAALIVAIVPGVLHGATAHVDPWFYDVWAGSGREGFNMNVTGALVLAAVALAGGGWLARRHPASRAPLAYLMSPLALYAALTVWGSTRWALYVEILAMPVIVSIFAHVWSALAQRPGWNWGVARVLSVLAVVVLPTLAIALAHGPMAATPPEQAVPTTARDQRCDVNALVAHLERLHARAGPKLILADPNLTPTLLAFTPHRVLSVPLYPDARAVQQSVETFLSSAARPSLPVGVDLVVACPVGSEHIKYDGDPAALHARLARGETVAGLRTLDAGQSAGGYRLFAVTDRWPR